MNEKHGFLYLFSGLGLGLGIGFLVAWVLVPIQFIDTTPASLRVDFKDEYRFMIASAYAANNDLLRAQARLGTLADLDPLNALGEQAQRMLASDSSAAEAQIVADLSTALQNLPAQSASPTVENSPTPTTQVSATPSPSATTQLSLTPSASPTSAIEETPSLQPKPIATLALRPTQTATPPAGKPFALIKQSTFCEPAQPGQMQVNLTNSAGKPAAGIELVITWLNGEEHFFTGFKPELGFGYADFTMTENIEYALSLSAGSTQVTGLIAPNCKDPQGSVYPGGIRLEFKQP